MYDMPSEREICKLQPGANRFLIMAIAAEKFKAKKSKKAKIAKLGALLLIHLA